MFFMTSEWKHKAEILNKGENGMISPAIVPVSAYILKTCCKSFILFIGKTVAEGMHCELWMVRWQTALI